MKCPYCGQEHPDNSKFCSVTGKPLQSQTKKCENCRYENVPIEAKFCPRCGSDFTIYREKEPLYDNSLFKGIKLPDYIEPIGTFNWRFSQGFMPAKNEGKIGFINVEGRFVIPNRYDDAGFFSCGLAPVKKADKWGYINRQGEFVLPFNFDFASSFHNGGWAFANKKGKKEIIDIKGNTLIEMNNDDSVVAPGFRHSQKFINIWDPAKHNKIYDTYGRLILACGPNAYPEFYNNCDVFVVSENDSYLLYNRDGKCLRRIDRRMYGKPRYIGNGLWFVEKHYERYTEFNIISENSEYLYTFQDYNTRLYYQHPNAYYRNGKIYVMIRNILDIIDVDIKLGSTINRKIIPEEYKSFSFFSDFIVFTNKNNDLCGIFTLDALQITPFVYEYVDIEDNIAIVKQNGSFFILDFKR